MKKLLLILLLCFTFSNGFSSDKKAINGRVLDERGFPVPGIIVSTTPGGSNKTDESGKFTIGSVDPTYTLYVTDESNSITIIYTGLTISDPDLILFGRKNGKDVNLANVDVIIEGIPDNSKGTIKFISQVTSYSKEEEITSGETKKQLTVRWPAGEKSINGNIVYLEKNGQKYTRYAERNVTLYNDIYQQSFKLSGIAAYEAVDSKLITIFLPIKEFATKYFSVWGDFMGYDRNSQIKLVSQNANIQSADTYVPSMLPFNFKLKVKAECFNAKGDGFINYTYTYPGSTVNLTYETPPEINSPSDKFNFVANNTVFNWQEGSGAGVFVINFHCLYPESDTYVVTKEKEVKWLVNSASNLNYTWNVSKYIPYFTVNDFIKARVFNNEFTYQAISYSKTYSFKTY